MSAELRLAVLISGQGSNLRALIAATAADDFPAKIVMVISNKDDAPGLKHAEAADISTLIISRNTCSNHADFEAEMTKAMEHHNVHLVCLAGFMTLLSNHFVTHWYNRIINIHPSLLPAFKGLDVHERAINAGVKFTGCTVHYVRFKMDTGPIIIQAITPVITGDKADSLATRVLKQEHIIYPLAVKWIAEGRILMDGERVIVSGAEPPMGVLINPEQCL